MVSFENSPSFAQRLDIEDPLRGFKEQFYCPKTQEGTDKIYFCGNSLGLQPKSARTLVESELLQWQLHGVEGHFMGSKPWFSYHKNASKCLSELVGAEQEEVVAMGSLTNNLHLLMISFYVPIGTKTKILVEKNAFSSDMYAIESQAAFHNLIPHEVIIEIGPREGEHCLRTEDILNTIRSNQSELALILLGGVNYYTGQVLDMEVITKAAKEFGIKIGYDLAHAIGNVKLELHRWQVDFAVWCTYKYLNSGPGSVAGMFVHQKYANDPQLKRLTGWWGHDATSRFKMQKGFIPIAGAEGWQLSNAPIVPLAIHQASLDIFERAGLPQIFTKSRLLYKYLIFVINSVNNGELEIITPINDGEHGSQVSLFVKNGNKELFYFLERNNIVLDWREPNVIRLAPVPLYNSFTEVFLFGKILAKGLTSV